jgi:predicted esterase
MYHSGWRLSLPPDAYFPDTLPMVEHHITVPRTARYCTLGEAGPAVREVWIVCHGFAQLATRFIRYFEPVAASKRLIVAPEALNRFYLDPAPGVHGAEARVGATWMTREDRENEIRDYVRYLDAVHDEIFSGLDRSGVRLVLLGFSQGTATVGRWLTRGEARADQIILWGGDLPEDLDLEANAAILNAQRPLMVVGDEESESYRERLERSRERALAAGIRIQLRSYSGGHRIHRETLLAVSGGGGG